MGWLLLAKSIWIFKEEIVADDAEKAAMVAAEKETATEKRMAPK